MNTEVKDRYTIDAKKKKVPGLTEQANEDENSAITIYDNIIQAHQEAAELHVPHKPANKKKSQWEGKKVVEKRGVLQDVLKDTSEEVRPKASKVENA